MKMVIIHIDVRLPEGITLNSYTGLDKGTLPEISP